MWRFATKLLISLQGLPPTVTLLESDQTVFNCGKLCNLRRRVSVSRNPCSTLIRINIKLKSWPPLTNLLSYTSPLHCTIYLASPCQVKLYNTTTARLLKSPKEGEIRKHVESFGALLRKAAGVGVSSDKMEYKR